MYTAYHIFLLLPIKDLTSIDGNPTTPLKLVTGMKPSISHFLVLFSPCVVQKATEHIGKKALKIRHQVKKGFEVYLLESHSTKKGILFTYHKNVRSYLRTMLFLMRVL